MRIKNVHYYYYYYYKAVRETAINLPKFGTSAGAENEDIQEITR